MLPCLFLSFFASVSVSPPPNALSFGRGGGEPPPPTTSKCAQVRALRAAIINCSPRCRVCSFVRVAFYVNGLTLNLRCVSLREIFHFLPCAILRFLESLFFFLFSSSLLFLLFFFFYFKEEIPCFLFPFVFTLTHSLPLISPSLPHIYGISRNSYDRIFSFAPKPKCWIVRNKEF